MPRFKVNLNDDYSWWDDHRGAFIFFGVLVAFIIIVGFPWLVGITRIVQWIV